jgi:hypothetical protein
MLRRANANLYYPYFFCLLSALIISAIFLPSKIMAQGNLLITPRRIVFQGQKRTEEINLANTGSDTARYLISMIEIRMKEDGTFEKISEPDSGQSFASSYLRFFPHSVTLGPNEAQTVKIQISKPGSLQPGEYRSHLYFRGVPDEKALGEAELRKDSSNISVHLVPIFGISIPVIIQVGESTTRASISGVSMELVNDTTPVLNIVLNRTGNMSIYGDIKINFISAKGKSTEVFEVKGVAVYTPTISRRLRIGLPQKTGIDYHSGKLHIEYTTSSENAKPVKIAETDFVPM